MFRGFASILLAIICAATPFGAGAQQGRTTRFIYDDNGRLRAVVSETGEGALYEYDEAGNFTAIRRLDRDTLALLDFFPRQGSAGDQVTFVGTAFSAGVIAVSFNGAAGRVVRVAPAAVIAEVPESATTGPVTITTARGAATTPAPFIVVSRLRVLPSSLTLVTGGSFQFTAVVAGLADQGVRWSVNGIEGGNPALGAISTAGLYTAPATPAASIAVRATSLVMPSLVGEAQVRVRDADGVGALLSAVTSVTRSPASGEAARAIPVAVARASFTLASESVSVATNPDISSISPNRLTRGATVDITIRGLNLAGASALRLLDSNRATDTNISASNLAASSDGTLLSATLTVNGGAAIGRRVVVVTAATGASLTVDVGTNRVDIVSP